MKMGTSSSFGCRSIIIILVVCLGLISAFKHESPGSCTASDDQLPDGATPENTYDYIFVGSGATSSVAIARLAKLSECSLKILVLEAGECFTHPPECTTPTQCYVEGVEKDMHLLPIFGAGTVVGTRSTWLYRSRVQDYSEAITYSNPSHELNGGTCPYSTPDFIPSGCGCTGDNWSSLNFACLASAACLNATGGNTDICGESACSPPNCAQNGTNSYPRASGKGGSNSHHAMATWKMSPHIAAKWVELTGDTRFSWSDWEFGLKEVVEEFLELSYVPNPIAPTWTHANDTFKALWREAALEKGYMDLTGPNAIKNRAEFLDPSNPNQGYYKSAVYDQLTGRQVTMSGMRSFPSAYLESIETLCAGMLNITVKALATSLIWNDSGDKLGRRTVGVEYITGGANFGLHFNHNRTLTDERLLNPHKAYARSGVILGGGVFSSPGMLMRAGVGIKKDLKAFDIPVRKELPGVGENLQDDYEHTLHYQLVGSDPTAVNGSYPGFASFPFYVPPVFKSLFGYDPGMFDNVTGIPTSPFPVALGSLCHHTAPVHGGRACPAGIPPDEAYLAMLQKQPNHYSEGVYAGHASFLTNMLQDDPAGTEDDPMCLTGTVLGAVFNGWYDLRFNYGGALGSRVALSTIVSRTLSYGKVYMKSTHPSDPLIIDNRSYKNKKDFARTTKCINKIRRLVDRFNQISENNPSKFGGMQLVDFLGLPFTPDPSVPKDGPSEGMNEYLRQSLFLHHPQGTLRMGKRSNKESVTDPKGRVWGTENLYVIDMSTAAINVDFFPSANAMTLGWMQGKMLWDSHGSRGACVDGAFVGTGKLDVESPASEGSVTFAIVAVIFGSIAVFSLLIITVQLATAKTPSRKFM